MLKEFLKAKQVDKDVENIEPSELKISKEGRISGILSASGESGVEVSSELRCLTSTQSNQQPLGLFSGANIHGGTFNIAINTVNQSPNFSSFKQQSAAVFNKLIYYNIISRFGQRIKLFN